MAIEFGGSANQFLSKDKKYSNPKTFGRIKFIYAEAIEYTSGPPGMRGLMFFVGVFICSILVPFGIWGATYGNHINLSDRLMLVFSLAGIFFLFFAIRFEFFRPEDEPIIFDRKNRRIYRIARDVHTGLKGLFLPWPIRHISYDWDSVDAKHVASLVTTGSTVTRYHSLVFMVKKNGGEFDYIEQFTIGNSLTLGEEAVAPFWEHIRRFMEDQGPHLPPQDAIAEARKPSNWWQSMKSILPKSSDKSFPVWLKEELPFALFLLAMFPLTLPMYLLWGTGNWLSHKTAITVKWPDEILQAIGAPIIS